MRRSNQVALTAGVPALRRSLIGVERPIQGSRERRLVDIVSLNAHPLGDALNVGRRVPADTKAGMRQRRLDQGRDRPLALGARDMDRAKRLLRVAEARGEIPHRLESDAHRVPRPALPVGERVEARHCVREVMILGHRAVIPESTAFLKAGRLALSLVRNNQNENEAKPYFRFQSRAALS